MSAPTKVYPDAPSIHHASAGGAGALAAALAAGLAAGLSAGAADGTSVRFLSFCPSGQCSSPSGEESLKAMRCDLAPP